MKVLAYPNPSAASYWRLHDPFLYLRELGVDAEVSDETITDEAAQWADIVVLQSTVNKEGIALLRAYQQMEGLKIVVDCDDLLELNDDNPHAIEHKIKNANEVIKVTMKIADSITCTNETLQKYLKQINPNVHIFQNYMNMKRWDLPKQENKTNRIRIGWAGSATHFNDLKSIVPSLIKIKKEYPQVDFIFMGENRIQDLFPFHVEILLGVPFEFYPSKLHGLRLDVALAPLLDTPFNRCKSNIKFQEYAVAQYPGVYSPTVYNFQYFEPKFGVVAEDPDHWYRAIKHLIDYPERRKEIKENAYELVKRKYDLKNHAQELLKIYQSLTH